MRRQAIGENANGATMQSLDEEKGRRARWLEVLRACRADGLCRLESDRTCGASDVLREGTRSDA